MHLNDLGSWCVVWIATGDGKGPTVSHAFFAHREQALTFQWAEGGELYIKQADGSLKRDG